MKRTLLAFVALICLSYTVNATLGAKVVSVYEFDNSCATDAVGTYNATATGVAQQNATKKVGAGSCYWDGGGGDKIELPAAQTNSRTQGTLAMWIQSDLVTDYNIWAKNGASERSEYVNANTDFYFQMGGSGTNFGTANPSLTSWTHIMFMWDGTRNTAFVDCVEYINASDTAAMSASGNLFLGQNSVNTNADFQGYLDQVALFNSTLTATERTELCSANPYSNWTGVGGGGSTPTNFTVLANNVTGAIGSYTAQVTYAGSTTNFTGTSGTAITTFYNNASVLANVTVYATGYTSNTTLNHNTSTNLTAVLYLTPPQTNFSINATNAATGSFLSTIYANVTLANGSTYSLNTSSTNIVTSLYNNGSVYANVTVAAPGYLANSSINYNMSANLSIALQPITYFWITAIDNQTSNNLTNFTVYVEKTFYVLQESANSTTGCSPYCNSSGNYGFRTSTNNSVEENYYYINYSKPLSAYSSGIFMMKHGPTMSSPDNRTIPSACYTGSTIQLRAYSHTTFGTMSECHNGSSWISVHPTVTGGNTAVTDIESPQLFYDGNYSTGIYYGDSIIPSVNAWRRGAAGDRAMLYDEGVYWLIRANETYTSTNGTVQVNWSSPQQIYNITVVSNQQAYFNTSYVNQNVSTNLQARLNPVHVSGPTNLTNNTINYTSFNIAWNNTNEALWNYTQVWLNSVNVANTTATIYAFSGLTQNTSYNVSLYSVTIYGVINSTATYLNVTTLAVTPPNMTRVSPTNATPSLQENASNDFEVEVTSNAGGNITVRWYKNAVLQLTEIISSGFSSVWTWVTGYQDSGSYTVSANATDSMNATASLSWSVTVEDTYPVPSNPSNIYPSSGDFEYSIPLLCEITYNPVAPYHYEFRVSVNGSAYSDMNFNDTDGFYPYDISADSYGANYTFGCRVVSPSGESNYTYSNVLYKVNKNHFYLFKPDTQDVYQHLVPYNLGFVAELDNSINASIAANLADCNSDGLWDYSWDFRGDNVKSARKTFACVNARGQADTTIGMVMYKNNTQSWESLGCKNVDTDENYCVVYKTYTVAIT